MTDKKPLQQSLDEKVAELMSQAKLFSSTWALAGSRFDDGTMFKQAKDEIVLLENSIRAAIAQPVQPGRTLLEEYDLNQSPEYHKGREDGRAKGYEVGYRHATEQIAQPVQPEQERLREELEQIANESVQNLGSARIVARHALAQFTQTE